MKGNATPCTIIARAPNALGLWPWFRRLANGDWQCGEAPSREAAVALAADEGRWVR